MNQHARLEFQSPDPYWWLDAPRSEPQDSPLPKEADVVIVGSGYAGASAALSLARAGRDVVVLERDRIGEGASTRNGGAVGETLRVSFLEMTRKFGEEAAIRYYKGVRAARAYLDELIETHAIDCDYIRCGRTICAHSPTDYESLARDLEARQKAIGFESEMVPQSDIHRVIDSDAYAGARVIHSDGNLHPAKYHRGLVAAAMGAGAGFVTQADVESVTPNGTHGFTVETPRGRVKTRDVIVATNGYTAGRFRWLSRRIIPVQSQIIATEPLPRETLGRLIPKNRQMGDTRKLHNYWRISPDGTRILFGGRAGAAETRNRAKSAGRLREQMLATYPELASAKITHAWAGYIAYTFDALPHIGSADGIHYIGGCCGSGVAMQPYLGDQTARKVLGLSTADCPFDSGYMTVPGYTGNPWFLPAAIGFLGLVDRSKKLFQQGRKQTS